MTNEKKPYEKPELQTVVALSPNERIAIEVCEPNGGSPPIDECGVIAPNIGGVVGGS